MAEFLVSLLFSMITLGLTAGLLRSQWDRTRCAYLTFEVTHARLVGLPSQTASEVVIEESPKEVRGKGTCAAAREKVRLKRLEELGENL